MTRWIQTEEVHVLGRRHFAQRRHQFIAATVSMAAIIRDCTGTLLPRHFIAVPYSWLRYDESSPGSCIHVIVTREESHLHQMDLCSTSVASVTRICSSFASGAGASLEGLVLEATMEDSVSEVGIFTDPSFGRSRI